MPYEPLHHKYRPQTFAELVGQEAIATTLTNALRQQRIAPAYLFTGARGTGKTSSARILAKSLNCLQSDSPTEAPCGKCEVCRAIANGSALDVIEIDAASNTGVDNIRELIERSQFAPVQCRHKVYVIDECLTGDSLVQTSEGLVRIDNPEIQGKQVLSYNDQTGAWEFKKVLRWFDQGVRPTYLIKTTNREIRCTGNHLIRTDQGWKPAAELQPGMKILSPQASAHWTQNSQSWKGFDPNVPADVARDYKSPRSLAKLASSTSNGIGRNIRRSKTTTKSSVSPQNSQSWKTLDPVALADVASNSEFLNTCSRDRNQPLLPGSEAIGSGTLTNKATASGQLAPPTSSITSNPYLQTPWALSTAPYWATAPSPTPTATAASPAWLGLTASNNKLGWNTKLNDSQDYVPSSEQLSTEATGSSQLVVAPPVIPNSEKFLRSSNLRVIKSKSLKNGSSSSLAKDWLGGTWTTAHSISPHKAVLKSNSTQKVTQPPKINLSQGGLQKSVIQLTLEVTQEPVGAKSTTTWQWEQILAESGFQTCSSTPSHQWNTSLEQVESVHLVGAEAVYDIEVEDNHNFVANGLCLHNCHMLSTAAFNALLKTLEEPPDRVVFVLATTDPQRVLPTIISRCQRFDFRRIPLEAMVHHLSAIAHNESIDIAPDAVQLVAQIAQGGLRDAESLLDQLSLLEGQVTVERVWDLVGAVPERDLLALLQAIATNDPAKVLDGSRHLMNRGREPLIVLQNLASFYRDLLIAKTAPSRGDLVAITPPTWAQLCEFAQQLPIALILEGQKYLRAAEVQIKNTTQPRLWLEVTLLGLLPSKLEIDQSTVRLASSSPQSAMPSSAQGHYDIPLKDGTILLGGPEIAPALPIQLTTQASSGNQSLSFFIKLKQLLSQVSSRYELSTSAADLEVLAEAISQALLHDQEFRSALISAPLATQQVNLSAVQDPLQIASNSVEANFEIAEEKSIPQTVSAELTGSAQADRSTDTNSFPETSDLAVNTSSETLTVNETNSQASPDETASQIQDLDNTWRKVLGQIEPRSTQALLGQQCRLVNFQGNQARITVNAPPLLKMAQARLSNVESAFEKVVGYPVKVSLAIASIPSPEVSPLPEQQLPKSADINQHPVGTEHLQNIPSSLPQNLPASLPNPPLPSKLPESRLPGLESSPDHAHPFVVTPSHVQEPQTLEPLQSFSPWQEEDEVTRAAKRLAEFFGGKVVDLEAGWSSDGDQLVAKPEISEWDEADSGAEADEVPF